MPFYYSLKFKQKVIFIEFSQKMELRKEIFNGTETKPKIFEKII